MTGQATVIRQVTLPVLSHRMAERNELRHHLDP